MEALKGLDPVAYVRFASVYRHFREAADFHEVLERDRRQGGSTASRTAGCRRRRAGPAGLGLRQEA